MKGRRFLWFVDTHKHPKTAEKDFSRGSLSVSLHIWHCFGYPNFPDKKLSEHPPVRNSLDKQCPTVCSSLYRIMTVCSSELWLYCACRTQSMSWFGDTLLEPQLCSHIVITTPYGTRRSHTLVWRLCFLHHHGLSALSSVNHTDTFTSVYNPHASTYLPTIQAVSSII